MKYAIYRADAGLIIRTITCPESVIAQQLQEGEMHLECADADSNLSHYVDSGALTPYPPRPSAEHEFDFAARAWFDPRTLAQLQDARWEEIKTTRTAALNLFTWDGSVFDSDEVSRGFILGAVVKVQVDPSHTEEWTLADNTLRTLGAAEIIAMASAMGTHISSTMDTGRTLRADIYSATTPEAVAAVIWPALP